MNYQTKFQDYENVTVSSFNPRAVGEREAISRYKEVKDLPATFHQRCQVIASLATAGFVVYFKTATGGGRARMFVVTEPGNNEILERVDHVLHPSVLYPSAQLDSCVLERRRREILFG